MTILSSRMRLCEECHFVRVLSNNEVLIALSMRLQVKIALQSLDNKPKMCAKSHRCSCFFLEHRIAIISTIALFYVEVKKNRDDFSVGHFN